MRRLTDLPADSPDSKRQIDEIGTSVMDTLNSYLDLAKTIWQAKQEGNPSTINTKRHLPPSQPVPTMAALPSDRPSKRGAYRGTEKGEYGQWYGHPVRPETDSRPPTVSTPPAVVPGHIK